MQALLPAQNGAIGNTKYGAQQHDMRMTYKAAQSKYSGENHCYLQLL